MTYYFVNTTNQEEAMSQITRWVKACLDCLERGVNANCVLVRLERSPASEPCDWCHRLTTGIRLERMLRPGES